jgi:hypothetical protein
VKEAGDQLRDAAGDDEFDLILSFSCSLRGATLGGTQADEDSELRKRVRAKQMFGLVASGEIATTRVGKTVPAGWTYSVIGLRG